jgi:hypothetical protein
VYDINSEQSLNFIKSQCSELLEYDRNRNSRHRQIMLLGIKNENETTARQVSKQIANDVSNPLI